MAEHGSSQGSNNMDAKQERLTREQVEVMRRERMNYWTQNAARLRKRNIITGLAIGGVVFAIYGYTILSVPQEKFLDELEDEAKVARVHYSKTSAN